MLNKIGVPIPLANRTDPIITDLKLRPNFECKFAYKIFYLQPNVHKLRREILKE